MTERRQVFTLWIRGMYTGRKRVVKVLATTPEQARHDGRLYLTSSEEIFDVTSPEPPQWEDELDRKEPA